jgi:hypothetical protein
MGSVNVWFPMTGTCAPAIAGHATRTQFSPHALILPLDLPSAPCHGQTGTTIRPLEVATL